jgi:hypothetical protein
MAAQPRSHASRGVRSCSPETDLCTGRGGGIGTPTDAADIGARIGGNKGAEDGNGGIRGQSLVVNQLPADTELVLSCPVEASSPATKLLYWDVRLWTDDVPLESERHVIPLDW